MNEWLKKGIITLSLISGSLLACDIHGHSGFMPKNNLKIPTDLKSMSGITEMQFNKVLDKINTLYASEIAKTGKKLVIERLWESAEVNAYAHQNTKGVDTIIMYGGLARHPETTEDAMALVACHEIGHHLGGAPRKKSLVWASNEGQADYWGAMKCLRHYFEKDDNISIVNELNVPEEVKDKCEQVYKNENEVALCERISLAGLALGRLLDSFSKNANRVSFLTPDNAVVTKIFDDHPEAQCRLDTYFQASLCDHGYSEKVSITDPNRGVCSVKNGDLIGNRPLCWYRP
jgi:hypothetical protein